MSISKYPKMRDDVSFFLYRTCSNSPTGYFLAMPFLTARETRLIACILAAVVVGAGVKVWREHAAVEQVVAASLER